MTVDGEIIGGKYRVVRLLGEGGMGAVYEAEHIAVGRHVAIKVIKSGDTALQQSLIARLHREARAAGAIDSDHIGKVLDVGTDEETQRPYLVMELLVGEDLHSVLSRIGPLEPSAAVRVVAQACLGLGKAHAARVVHRDIKPANLFLARRDAAPGQDAEVVVKVLDFGIAKLKEQELGALESGSLTRTGSLLGSPLYMSPEQARGTKTVDHRADVWSLGVVFYQALTGRTPYEDIEAFGELILAICSELPANVQDYAPWVPPEIAAIVHKALCLDAAQRFQTAEEMYQALAPHMAAGLRLTLADFRTPDQVVRSVRAPRLIEERGRRPITRAGSMPAIVVSPSNPGHPGQSYLGQVSDPSAPTLAVAVTGGTQAGIERPVTAERRPSKVALMAGALFALLLGVVAAFAFVGGRTSSAASDVAPVQPGADDGRAASAGPVEVVAPADRAAADRAAADGAPADGAPADGARDEPSTEARAGAEPSASAEPSVGAAIKQATASASPGVQAGAPGSTAPRTLVAPKPPSTPTPQPINTVDTSGFGDRK